MRSKRYRAPKDEARLKAFLARSAHPEGTLSLGELRGFLFALNAAPELVKPSEWIPFVFSGEEPEFRDMEEAEEVMASLMHLYNHINKIVRAEGSRLPPGCVFLDPPMANLEPEAPVSQRHEIRVPDYLPARSVMGDQPGSEDLQPFGGGLLRGRLPRDLPCEPFQCCVVYDGRGLDGGVRYQ